MLFTLSSTLVSRVCLLLLCLGLSSSLMAQADNHLFLYDGMAYQLQTLKIPASAGLQTQSLRFGYNEDSPTNDLEFLPLQGVELKQLTLHNQGSLNADALARHQLGQPVLVPAWLSQPTVGTAYEQGILKSLIDGWTAAVEVNKQTRLVSVSDLRFPAIKQLDTLVAKVGADAVLMSPTGGQAAWLYPVQGLNVTPSYTLLLSDQEGGKATFQGLLSVSNTNHRTLPASNVHVMVGYSHYQPHAEAYHASGLSRKAMLASAAADGVTLAEPPSIGEAEAVGQLYRYSFNQPVSFMANQTQRLPFVTTQQLSVVQRYWYSPQSWWLGYTNEGTNYPVVQQGIPVQTSIKFENKATAQGNMGQPLPSGRLTVFQLEGDNRPPAKLGDATLPHTPKDETVELPLGRAMDVVVTKKQSHYRKLALGNHYEVTFNVEVKNHHHTPVTVEVQEPVHQAGAKSWSLENSNIAPRNAKEAPLVFDVTVPAQKSVTLTYTLKLLN